jgi:hypothetical protein
MKPQKESLIALRMATSTPNGSLIQHYTSQEIWNLMREAESLEWVQRYKAKIKSVGKLEARRWWIKTITDIERIRGKEAAQDLRDRMNRIQNVSNDISR